MYKNIFVLCALFFEPLVGMANSLEQAQENIVSSICKQYQDPYQAFAEIEKQCSPSCQDLSGFTYIAEFSKHLRALLCKMGALALSCGGRNAEELLQKTMFTRLSPLMQEFMLRRFTDVREWKTACAEMEDVELEYLRMHKTRPTPTGMSISLMPQSVTVTYEGKRLWPTEDIKPVFISSALSKTAKFLMLTIEYYPDVNSQEGYLFLQQLNAVRFEILCLSPTGKYIDIIKAINPHINHCFVLPSERAGMVFSAFTNSKFVKSSPLATRHGEVMATLVNNGLSIPSFKPRELNAEFSYNDEYLCITSVGFLFLIDLSTKAAYKIGEGIAEAVGKPAFSSDATILCLLVKNLPLDGLNCLIIDTFSRTTVGSIELSFSFFRNISIIPNNNSLIFKAKSCYQLYKKKYEPHYLFREHCTQLFIASYLTKKWAKWNSFARYLDSFQYRDSLITVHNLPHRDLMSVKRRFAKILLARSRKKAHLVSNSTPPSASQVEESVIERKKNNKQSYKNYLSLDARGTDVLIVSNILRQIEDYLGKPVANYFDVVTGSGFGAILALGLVASLDGSQSLVSLNSMHDIFVQNSSYIFRDGRVTEKPYYDSRNLRSVLRDLFHNARLSDSITQFIMPVHILGKTALPAEYSSDSNLHLFSYSRDQAQMRERDNIDLVQLALYATADSKFFPVLDVQHYLCRDKCKIMASKVYRNNAAQYIVDECMQRTQEPAVKVLSISPHLLSEASLRTHNILQGRLGENYAHLHANKRDILKEPDNYSQEIVESYLSQDKVAKFDENFLRRLVEDRSSNNALALLED